MFKQKQITSMQASFWRFVYFFAAIISVIYLSTLTLGAISQSYETDDSKLVPGMVVSLTDDSSSENPLVERAGISNTQRLVGITTTIEESLVSVARANRSVYVQTEGEAAVYVVDTGGAIENGDLLQLSSIRGVLEKHTGESGTVIIGTALESTDFSGGSTYEAVQGDNGDADTVRVERINIGINNQVLTASVTEGPKMSALAELGYSLTGRDIGEVRVLIALIIFLVVMITEGGIIYGAISSAVTALGRNPLAKKFIRQELVRIFFVAISVLCIGVGAIFAILFA